MDVEAFLNALPIGAVFTHANPRVMPDSWVKVGPDTYRRTYDWIIFSTSDFARTWTYAELTDPVPGSIDQEEADRRRDEELGRHRGDDL